MAIRLYDSNLGKYMTFQTQAEANNYRAEQKRKKEERKRATEERKKREAAEFKREQAAKKRQAYLDDLQGARDDAEESITDLKAQKEKQRDSLMEEHRNAEGTFDRAVTDFAEEYYKRKGTVPTNRELEKIGLGKSQRAAMRERHDKQVVTFDENTTADLQQLKQFADSIRNVEPTEATLREFEDTLRQTVDVISVKDKARANIMEENIYTEETLLRKKAEAIDRHLRARGRGTNIQELTEEINNQALGNDSMQKLNERHDEQIARFDEHQRGTTDEDGNTTGGTVQLSLQGRREELLKRMKESVGRAPAGAADVPVADIPGLAAIQAAVAPTAENVRERNAEEGQEPTDDKAVATGTEVADDPRQKGKDVQIKFPDTKDTIQSPEMFEAAYMVGAGAKIAGAYAAFEESSWEQDNRIRTAEINEMMLDYEAADLEENYADRMNIIAQRGAQQAGEMKAAAAAGGIDIDSISAQQGAAAQRQVTRDDMDAIRSQVVAARRGIHIRKANLGIEKEAAKMQGSLERTKAITGGLLDLGKDYFDFQSVVPKNKKKATEATDEN